jgi:hypothetical protein
LLEGSAVRWTGRYRAPLRELSALDARSCYAAAFLRYARVPFWLESAGTTVVGDLRYDRAPELEFAEMEVPSSANCPRWVPSWIPPRSSLLRR